MADVSDIKICEPRMLEDQFGNVDPYYCGRLLLLRNVEDKEERCPGGAFICADCVDGFAKFMERVGNARAVDKEGEVV